MQVLLRFLLRAFARSDSGIRQQEQQAFGDMIPKHALALALTLTLSLSLALALALAVTVTVSLSGKRQRNSQCKGVRADTFEVFFGGGTRET